MGDRHIFSVKPITPPHTRPEPIRREGMLLRVDVAAEEEEDEEDEVLERNRRRG